MLTSVAPCSRQPVAPTACLLLSRVQRDSSLAAWGGRGGRGGREDSGERGERLNRDHFLARVSKLH